MNSSLLLPKTPISYLQELCARKGLTPKYDLMSIEGAVHEPTFIYRVTVGDITAKGHGQSKKKAKHMAAKAVLEILLSGQTDVTSFNQASRMDECVAETKVSSILSPYDDGIPGNPVGSLQEFCMSRRWPPPTYDVVEEHGLPHERMFTMACIVKKYIERGVGKSKKLAKRQTAFNMLQYLRQLPGKTEDSNMNDDDDDERFYPLKDNKNSNVVLSVAQRISQFYRNMKAAQGKTLALLHNVAPSVCNMNSIQLLNDIAVENKFDVTYVDVEEISKSGKFQCLLQLSTLPVAVCHGTGDSPMDAQENSALNALEYLRIMTRE